MPKCDAINKVNSCSLLYLSSPLSSAQETHIKFFSLCRATLTSQDGDTTLLFVDDDTLVMLEIRYQIEFDIHLDNDTFFCAVENFFFLSACETKIMFS